MCCKIKNTFGLVFLGIVILSNIAICEDTLSYKKKVIVIGEDGRKTVRDFKGKQRKMDAVPELKNKRTLNILSYNIQGLPAPFMSNRGQYKEIGRLLKERRDQGTAPDVVAIQEGFSSDTKELVEASGYKHVIYGNSSSLGHISSGLIILTDLQVESSKNLKFQHCYSHDCYSNKGLQLVRLKIKDISVPIDIYNTHLNSNLEKDFWSDADGPDDTRWQQIHEIVDFIQVQTPSQNPFFLVGDFNMRSYEDEYDFLFASLTLVDASNACLKINACLKTSDNLEEKYKKGIDHQFYRYGASPLLRITPTAYFLRFTQKFKEKDLSDHDGLEFEFKLEY